MQAARPASEGKAQSKQFAGFSLSMGILPSLEEFYSNVGQDFLDKAKIEASWIADFLHAAIKEVNFYEIAESLIAEVEQTQAA
jgi:hypothetical protein